MFSFTQHQEIGCRIQDIAECSLILNPKSYALNPASDRREVA